MRRRHLTESLSESLSAYDAYRKGTPGPHVGDTSGCAHVQAGKATDTVLDFPILGGQLMMRRLIWPSTMACKCSQMASTAQASFHCAGSMYFQADFRNV